MAEAAVAPRSFESVSSRQAAAHQTMISGHILAVHWRRVTSSRPALLHRFRSLAGEILRRLVEHSVRWAMALFGTSRTLAAHTRHRQGR